jgi:hypothetical protein
MRVAVTLLICATLFAHASGVSAINQTFNSKQCNGCSAVQRDSAAIGQGGQNGAIRYVDDLTSGVLYKYMIEREPIVGGYTYSAIPQVVEPEYQAVTTNLKALWDANSHRFTYKTSITIPASRAGMGNGYDAINSGPAGSAFDVVDPGAGRNNTIDWLRHESNWPVGNQIVFHYQVLVGAYYRMVQGTPITITFDVHFPDGSRADFIFTYPDNNVTYVDKSAIDSAGNPIPQSADDIVRGPGSTGYDFHEPVGDDWTRAEQRFAMYGISITRGYYYACTRDPLTGVHCVHYY